MKDYIKENRKVLSGSLLGLQYVCYIIVCSIFLNYWSYSVTTSTLLTVPSPDSKRATAVLADEMSVDASMHSSPLSLYSAHWKDWVSTGQLVSNEIVEPDSRLDMSICWPVTGSMTENIPICISLRFTTEIVNGLVVTVSFAVSGTVAAEEVSDSAILSGEDGCKEVASTTAGAASVEVSDRHADNGIAINNNENTKDIYTLFFIKISIPPLRGGTNSCERSTFFHTNLFFLYYKVSL